MSSLPPYAITIEKRKELSRSINDLRFNIPNWYRTHNQLEGLHDDPLGFPQEIPPTTHLWKTMGIPTRCSDPFFSHRAFSDGNTTNDRRRRDPDTNRFVLSTNTRYGLEEVYHRHYGARRQLNPIAQRAQTIAAVNHKMLNRKNLDCLDVQREQLLREAGARNYKSSAPFHTQRDKLFVTQAGDFEFASPEVRAGRLYAGNEYRSPETTDTTDLKAKNGRDFNIGANKPQPGSEGYEKHSILEAKNDINEGQAQIRNAITGGEVNVRSGNVDRLRKLSESDGNGFGGMKNVGYVDTPTEEYMKEIGVGSGPVGVNSWGETLVEAPDYTRVVLSSVRDDSALSPAPVYHSMVWKTQLNRDFHAFYRDPLPEEDLCTKVYDLVEMKDKFGCYHHLDYDPTALKLKLILK